MLTTIRGARDETWRVRDDQPLSVEPVGDSEQIANAMRDARVREYGDLIDEVEQLAADRDSLVPRTVQRHRRTCR